jgi:hypothetical protein
MKFDKIAHKIINGETVDYGFIFGNNKIVFIKAGAGGGIPGYQDKYLRMAHRVHERLGATVICVSNRVNSLEMDRRAISWCINMHRPKDVELYFVGVSDGAYQCIFLCKNVITKKLLCINPSFVPGRDPTDSLTFRTEVKKIFVYGTEDEEGRDMIPMFEKREIPNFEIKLVEGADHSFTGMVDKFISMVDLL